MNDMIGLAIFLFVMAYGVLLPLLIAVVKALRRK